MASNGVFLQSAAALGNVYEIHGEPAVVIDGLPNLDQRDHSHPAVITEAESERYLGFGEWMEGREVQKKFGKQLYSGTVTEFDKETGWYRVVYTDGDFEDLEWHELEEILVPLDIGVPLKTLALKRLENNEMHARNTTGNQLPSGRRGLPMDVKRRRASKKSK